MLFKLTVLSMFSVTLSFNWRRNKVQQTLDEYIETSSIPYQTFIGLYETAQEDIDFVPNDNIDPNTRFVHVGFHGTSSETAKSIASNGLSSGVGVFDKHVYLTTSVQIAAKNALHSFIEMHHQNGNFEVANRTGEHDTICHFFAPADDIKDRQVIKISKKNEKKIAQEKKEGLETEFDRDAILVLPSTRMVLFSKSSSKKLVTFCEPLLNYTSPFNFYRHFLSLIFKSNLFPWWKPSIVKEFTRRSLLKNIPVINMERIAKMQNNLIFYEHPKISNNAERCVYCKTAKKHTEKPGDFLLLSHSPMFAQDCMMVIPNTHIGSVLKLTRSDVPLLIQMKNACQEYVNKEHEGKTPIMGFDIPNPTVTLFSHLQMYCIVPPIENINYQLRFMSHTFPFISIDELIDDLNAGKKLKKVGRLEYFLKYVPNMQQEAERIRMQQEESDD